MKNLITFFIFLFAFSPLSKAQEKNSRSLEIPFNAKATLDQLISFAIQKDIFIANLNMQSNFIQLTEISTRKKKGMLSLSDGERLTYSILLQDKNDSETIIRVQIRVEKIMDKNFIKYYEDKGVTPDSFYYEYFEKAFEAAYKKNIK